jgi:hypothetical protein
MLYVTSRSFLPTLPAGPRRGVEPRFPGGGEQSGLLLIEPGLIGVRQLRPGAAATAETHPAPKLPIIVPSS